MFFQRRSDASRSRGQAMVEFAIVAPLLALFLVIAIDFGRAFFSYVQITNGAREAAAQGAAAPTDNTAMRNRALLEANVQDHGGENPSIQVTAECRTTAGATIDCATAGSGAGPGNTITVTVTRNFTLITPLAGSIVGNPFQMSTSATAPILGFASSGGGGGPGGGCPSPTASFTVTVLTDLNVEVDPQNSTPQSPGDPCNLSGFFWYWGDGDDQVGSASAAQHTYANAGTYTITLEVTNQEGTATTTRQVTVPSGAPVTCDPPTAQFSVSISNRDGGGRHRWFTYVDQSLVDDPVNCPITGWLWTFHNTSPVVQSNAQYPAEFQYSSGGSKSVTLQVTNAGGSHSITRSDG